MTEFIIRVRLEKATDDKYIPLIKAMNNNGYSIKILSKEGTSYILPIGNFRIESDQDKYAWGGYLLQANSHL